MNFNSISSSRNNWPSASWNQNSDNIDGVEFMFKSPRTPHTQHLLVASSSNNIANKRWDVRLVKSGSHPTRGKIEFRISKDGAGAASLATNHLTMSTDYGNFKGTGWWNVLLQTMTGSTTTQSYQLIVAQNDKDTIPHFYTTNLLGGLNRITNTSVNQNFTGSSRLSFGNHSFSGSLAEIRAWSGSLSASKFKQHVLNPHNHTGNNIGDSWNKLIWRFRLAENKPSGSTNIILRDSNASFNGNFTYSSSLTNYGDLYDTDLLYIYKLSTRTDGTSQRNDNQITINSFKSSSGGNLSPVKYVTKDNSQLNKRKSSYLIDLRTSPTDVLDDIIIDKLSDQSISDAIGKESDRTSYDNFYSELEEIRKNVFKDVTVHIGDYIRAQEKTHIPFLLEKIERLTPARVTTLTGGVIKPDLLHRTKLPQASSSFGEK